MLIGRIGGAQIQDGMAVLSPLEGDDSSDGQLHKLVTLSLASAGSFVLLLALFPLLVRTTGRRAEEPTGLADDALAADDTNSSFGNGLRRSLDHSAAGPCDDFYGCAAFLPEMDLRRANRTVLTLSPGWLETSLAENRTLANLQFLAALYGREDLSRRLEHVHRRVALAAAALHQNSSKERDPSYTTVEGAADFSEYLPDPEVLLAMINLNFPAKNQVTLADDVYVTIGGRAAFQLAALFATEVSIDDAEAAGAFVSTLLLRQLAVPASAKLSSMLQMSKYKCFELVHEVAPHATALFLSEVPDDLFDEALLERHYSYLPIFRTPFIRSYLTALRRRADRAKASLHRHVATARRMSHRLPMLEAKPLLLPFYGLLFVPVASMLPPILVRESPEATYAALGHLVARELVSALYLSAADASSDGLFVSRSAGRSAADVQRRLTCLRRSSPSNKARLDRLEEVYADVVGLQVALRALGAATPGYKPLAQSAVVRGWTSLQVFYLSSCFKWCAFQENEVEGTVGSHRERCNVPLVEEPGFLAAFNCSADSRMVRERQACLQGAL
ncbi:hypothetical protein V5799_016324 [Amblyomma americanum]|uniref:Peptidase M13 C-terminal domain-containing protein n=2 Tax=Amblyomma americanum TaxID=6943 RepID=A0AAQ4F6K8_AMBAM